VKCKTDWHGRKLIRRSSSLGIFCHLGSMCVMEKPVFVLARIFTPITRYWLVPGMDLGVCLKVYSLLHNLSINKTDWQKDKVIRDCHEYLSFSTGKTTTKQKQNVNDSTMLSVNCFFVNIPSVDPVKNDFILRKC
jgi:hypothetical protein